ncbi:MAG: DUF3836 domain-containing protein [Bacteroidales bacterium]|nr:DUF3836 domain-containing protein [Bacteroidales bacterium]
MKKFMMMALVAAMTMTMGSKAMAAETKPVSDAYETEMTRLNDAEEIRTLLHINGTDVNKFEYVIDHNGRVSTKTMYRLNKETNTWTPLMVYRATYGKAENTLSYAAYSAESHAFTAHAMKTTYSKSECPVLIALPECLNY